MKIVQWCYNSSKIKNQSERIENNENYERVYYGKRTTSRNATVLLRRWLTDI